MTTLIKARDQITLTDITDNYSVNLSRDSYVFTGTTTSGTPGPTSCSTTITVFRGGEQIVNPASGTAIFSAATSYVDPDGVISASFGNTTGKENDPYVLTVSIAQNKTLSIAKEIPFTITINLGNNETATINKTFTVTTTKKGTDGSSVTVDATHIYYGTSTDGEDPDTVTDWTEDTVLSPSDGEFLWTKTVVVYDDPSSTTTTSYSVSYKAIDGSPGGDAYSVVLSNESHTFMAGISKIVAATDVIVTVYAYKGSTAVTPTIDASQITGQVANKLTASVNGSVITISATANLDVDGTLTIPVVVDGKTFNKNFSWALAKKGNTGSSPTIYWLELSNVTAVRSASGSYTPSAITFIAKSQTGSNAVENFIAGSYRITTDGATPSGTWTALETTSPYTNSYTIPTGTTTSIKIELAKENSSASSHTVIDEQTIAIVKDGQNGTDGFSIWTTNDAVSSSKFTIGNLHGPAGQTPKVDEIVISKNRYQYTITAVGTTQVTVGAETDLKGPTGDDGYNVATVNMYKRANTTPSKPYASYSGTLTYTFSSNSFSTTSSSDTGGWSMSVPAIDGNPLYVSSISLSSRSASVTVNKTNFTSPTTMAEDGKMVFISANPQTFSSTDGGNTYSPDSVVLTPRFQNTTYRKWYYINSGGTEVDLTSSPPTGVSINSTTKALTITKAAVSDLSSGSAAFKNYKSIVFKCEVNETDANNNYIYDTFTVVKLKDGKAIASVEIKYGMSASSTTAPSTWYDSISSITTWTPGYFLWERYKYTYSDGTTEPSGANDYIYVKSMQGQTGVGIESITPLHYLRVIVEGYKSGSTFYEDSAHTKAITPVDNCYYLDKGVTPNKYWQYVTSAYVDRGTTAPPDPPSAPHQASTGAQADDISNNTKPNQWTTNTPRYISGGTYYISEEVAYDDNTYQYSAVVPDNIVTDAYMDIDRNTGQINLISEQVLNLEQTDDVDGASITFQKDCYVGTLHRLTIAPTGNTEAKSVKGLYPSTSLYPNTDLYPREIILVVDCGSSAYGTKYKYYLDIDALIWTNVNVYDEFVYEDGKCWIIRRTISGGSTVETIEYRNPVIPVDPVITVGTEEIQVSNSLIYIPQKSDVTLRLVGANSSANPVINYKATYLIDNPYTSNFTSSLDLISQINMSPGSIKIKANNIALEGYTTVNQNFKIDLEGNMECMDAKINGNLVTEQGILTNITFVGDYWDCSRYYDSAWENPKKYALKMGNSLHYVGINGESDDSRYTFWYEFLNFPIVIPDNFIPIKLRIMTHSGSATITWDNNSLPGSCTNVGVFTTTNLGETNYLDMGGSAWLTGCVPNFSRVNTIDLHTFPAGTPEDYVFEGDATAVFSNGPGLYNICLKTADSLPADISGTYANTVATAANKISKYASIIDAVCEVIGYMQISTEEGE